MVWKLIPCVLFCFVSHGKAFSSFLRLMMSLEVRTIAAEGIIFYISDGIEQNDFIGMEVSAGRLVFAFNAGHGTLRLTTTRTYNDGQWHTVSELSVFVSICRSVSPPSLSLHCQSNYSKIGCRRTHVLRGQARCSYLQAAFLSRSYNVQCRM